MSLRSLLPFLTLFICLCATGASDSRASDIPKAISSGGTEQDFYKLKPWKRVTPVYLRLARKAEYDGRLSMSRLQQAIAEHPESVQAYLDLANVQLAAGEADQALVNYNHAIRFTPSLVKARLGRSKAYEALGKQQLSLQDAQYCVAHSTGIDHVEMLAQCASINSGLHRYDETVKLYSTLLQNPLVKDDLRSRAIIYSRRAETYSYLNKPALALKDSLAAAESTPNIRKVQIEVALAYLKNHQPQKTVEILTPLIEKARRKNNDFFAEDRSESLYTARAAAYDMLGNRQQAVQDRFLATQRRAKVQKTLPFQSKDLRN